MLTARTMTLCEQVANRLKSSKSMLKQDADQVADTELHTCIRNCFANDVARQVDGA